MWATLYFLPTKGMGTLGLHKPYWALLPSYETDAKTHQSSNHSLSPSTTSLVNDKRPEKEKGSGKITFPSTSLRGLWLFIFLVWINRLQPTVKVPPICGLCNCWKWHNPGTKMDYLLMSDIVLNPLSESFYHTRRYKYYCCPHFSDEETEVSRDEVTFPKYPK